MTFSYDKTKNKSALELQLCPSPGWTFSSDKTKFMTKENKNELDLDRGRVQKTCYSSICFSESQEGTFFYFLHYTLYFDKEIGVLYFSSRFPITFLHVGSVRLVFCPGDM